MHRLITILLLSVCAALGCGTTRSSDTTRTATEQLLLSDAIDRAVESLDMQMLEGQSVYLDDSRIGSNVVDRDYLISSIRQHMLASGCVLKANRDEADFVLEARSGTLGTDRNDLLFGIPATNVPQVVPLQGVPAALPEIPFAKRSLQRAVAKLAVFAYHRESGEPVWQSGLAMSESTSQGFWLLGAGPFQKGSIYDGTKLPGQSLQLQNDEESRIGPRTRVAETAIFNSPQQLLAEKSEEPNTTAEGTGNPDSQVQPATYSEVTPPKIVNKAYAELPLAPELKAPNRPPPHDQKARALPPFNGETPGTGGR
jgi:hypothetical protein